MILMMSDQLRWVFKAEYRKSFVFCLINSILHYTNLIHVWQGTSSQTGLVVSKLFNPQLGSRGFESHWYISR